MSGNNGGSESNDPVVLVLFGIVLVVVVAAVIWFIFHTELSIAAIHAAWYSLPTLSFIVSAMESIGTPVWIMDLIVPIDVIKQLPILRDSLLRQDPRQVDLEFFTLLLSITGFAFRLITPLIAAYLIYYVLKESKAARYKRSMNIFKLATLTSETFPQIRPAIIENLFQVNPDTGDFRREESPIRYAIQNNLIMTYDIDFRGSRLAEKSTPTFIKSEEDKDKKIYYVKDDLSHHISKLHDRCILDLDKTKLLFIKQLGPQWTGSENLPPMIRGIYAGLLAFACADKDLAMGLFEQFNHSWKREKVKSGEKNPILIDLSRVEEIINKYESRERIQEILNSHGFVTTVMQRLLRECRTKGRIATSVFLWLKCVDRTIWYCLNQEGGQCSWIEATGPRAHFLAELSANGALFHPFVATAVTETEYYLAESEGWIPKESK